MQRLLCEEKEAGLIYNASYLPNIDHSGNILLFVWFSGDTLNHKEEIKSLGGYTWQENQGAESFFSKPSMCWGKTIIASEVKVENAKAISIGAKPLQLEEGIFAKMHYEIAKQRKQEFLMKQEAIASIERPKVPDILKGRRWNQKVYGNSGGYTIYPDSVKCTITDEQKDEIDLYLKAKAEYQKRWMRSIHN